MQCAPPGLVTAIAATSPGVSWSICILDGYGRELASHQPDTALGTASIGKLLLAEVARRYEAGSLLGTELLHPSADLAVADSGLWQHLQVGELPVADLAVLVASTSDNWATNVLLERVGLASVQALGRSLGLTRTVLLDRVRELRTSEHPPSLSTGSAGELARFMSGVRAGEAVSPAVSEQLTRWLASGVDLSMVASPLGLDPLAHAASDRGLLLRNKTGTDAGVRADTGFVTGPEAVVSYAVIANWDSRLERMADDAEWTRDDDCLRLALCGRALLERHRLDDKGRCRYCRQRCRWWQPPTHRCAVVPILWFYLQQPRALLESRQRN